MDNIEHRIEQLHLSTSAETDKRILDDAFVALKMGLQTQKTGIRQWLLTNRMAKPLAAAAVILIAVILFMSLPDKGFDSVEDFYSNLGGVANVCVSTFSPGQTEPDQQVWTSQDLKVRLFKTGIGDQARYSLLDLGNKVQTTMFLSNVKTEPLTEEKLRDLRQSMTPSFALAPFFNAADVPDGAKWHIVTDPAVVAAVPRCKVYELVWEQESASSEGFTLRKWRVFVDVKTHLPKRTESYVKADSEYRLEKFALVTYPGQSEIKNVVASTIGRTRESTGDPEYIGTPGIDR